jgi:SAM-dependent methyltransferase
MESATPASTWGDVDKVEEYVERIGRVEARAAGERELADVLPRDVTRVLDLGCGDGRLMALVVAARPDVHELVGLDNSPPMIERAQARFRDEPRVTIIAHDLRQPLPDLGVFDVVTSGFAIHHLPHERKQRLFAEAADVLRPGGVFVNLEVVECATPALQAEFYERIGRPGGDPEDVLSAVEPQLEWMRSAGLADVDCYWRWREFALLVGHVSSVSSAG